MIAWLGGTWVPAGGSTLMTVPFGTSPDACCWTLTVANPADESAAWAAPWVWPTTFGTATLPDPDDTAMVMVDCGGTCWLAAGSCEMTVSSGTSSFSCGTTFTTNPAWVRACCAAVCVRPTTSGTVTGSGPWLTVSVTVDPASASTPASGSCFVTWLAGAVGSLANSVFTSKPSASRAPVATVTS